MILITELTDAQKIELQSFNICNSSEGTHRTMGPDELVDTKDGSGTIALAEDSALAAFFSLPDFLLLGTEEHLLAI